MQGGLPDLEKLSLEKGRPLDVEDLDDSGWKAAKKEGRIVELGSLGEGAGGAVTRCVLKGGKTVFALKVSRVGMFLYTLHTDYTARSLLQTPIRMLRNRSCESFPSTSLVLLHISANIMAPLWTTPLARLESVWSFAKVAHWTASTER